MKAVPRSTTAKITAVVVVCFGLFAGGVAVASLGPGQVLYSGGSLLQTKVATDEDGWPSSAINVWQKVTATTVKVVVPSGATRLLNAHFNAESFCDVDADWCSVRIVARKGSSGSVLEFRPRVETDFAFDSPGGETWEGNSVDRSLRVGAGTWYVWVQAQVVGGTTGTMYLDDWHFEVDVFK